MRLVFDLRKLNAILQRKEHYFSTIDELISGVGGFLFASAVDLNMGYLSILLNEAARKLLTIVFTFGYFKCLALPQGVKPAMDIFQARMVGIFASIQMNRPCPYLDDIFHYEGEMFDECLQILDEIFERLSVAGMQVNPEKSHIMAIEVELLGFILTRIGAKPTPKQIEAILKLAPSKNV